MRDKYYLETSAFSDLTPDVLYKILQLRSEIFVIEQNCVYQDLDDKDQSAFHVILYDKSDKKIVGYTRLLPKGISYKDYCSIGRVVMDADHRGMGLGKELMAYSIRACIKLFGTEEIKISAQTYLKQFYRDLGFWSSGASYLEDGIPHVAMIYLKDDV